MSKGTAPIARQYVVLLPFITRPLPSALFSSSVHPFFVLLCPLFNAPNTTDRQIVLRPLRLGLHYRQKNKRRR